MIGVNHRLAGNGCHPAPPLEGTRQNAGIWFPEPTVEMCMRSDKYDFELTLLHFEGRAPAYQAEDEFEDSYTQFFKMGASD